MLEPAALREAFTARTKRRVRRDSTLDVDGKTYELAQGFLAGKTVVVAHCLIDEGDVWVEHDDERYPLVIVDPSKNADRRRPKRAKSPDVAFDPASARLDKAVCRSTTDTAKAKP